jgi:Protein of unknown function (DUF2924)
MIFVERCRWSRRRSNLDAETLEVLRQAAGLEGRPPAVSRAPRRFAPLSGKVLVREWDRKSHRVMVMPDGFAWNGRIFGSLSQVAFAITDDATEPDVFSIPWQKPLSKRGPQIPLPHGVSRDNLRPERAERRARLVSAIAPG